MVHRRVADQDDAGEALRGDPAGVEEPGHEFAHLPADHGLERLAGARRLDPAHEVGAVARLRVERRLHAEDGAGAEVDELRHERRRAQVDRDARRPPAA